jgi:NhaP-type Na+/H+ or K+/H+ antiporter
MSFHLWLLVIAILLLVMALAHPIVERLPITPTIIYLFAGIALGPWGVGALRVDPFAQSDWLLHGSEIAVVISLFTVGMKLRLPWSDRRFRPAFCLASVSMVLTTGLAALVGRHWLGLSIGAAVLFGAMLAPTDPVLASDVQVQHPKDRDKIRLTLSAEAGLNDGTAFPFVILGLGLLQHHELGAGTWRWWVIDVLWSVAGGLTIGAVTGYGLGRLLLYLQTTHKRAVAFGEYLVLGVIGVSYAAAVFAHAGGFLAVFAAGVALRAVEMKTSRSSKVIDETSAAAEAGTTSHKLASNPKTASAYFAGVLLATNELLENLLAVGVVLLVGALLAPVGFAAEVAWFAPVLFLVIRPLAALPVLFTGKFSRFEFFAVSWFGIRGIGSVYYLMYAIQHGLDSPLAHRLASLTLSVIAVSIVVHGVSVTPLFQRYRRKPA